MSKYRLGLYEKAMPAVLSLHEKLSAVKAAGFDTMELSIDETEEKQQRLYWGQAQRRLLKTAIQENDIQIASLCLSAHRKCALGSRDEATRLHGREIFYRAVDFAYEMGIRIIQLAGYDVYYEQGDNQTRAWFEESLGYGVEYAAQAGILCGFETMETPFMDTVSKAMQYVKKINSPYLGVYPDLGNLTNACALYGQKTTEELAAAQGHLVAMHLKETKEGVYRDMRFGEGRVDFVSGIQTAWQLGVRYYVAECWDDGRASWQEGIKEVNAFIRQSFAKAGV